MAGEIAAAWIAAGASIVVSFGTAIWTSVEKVRSRRRDAQTARQLEALRSRLSDEADAAKAKRDYEYEARKRLYAELYPLAYQLQQAALHAQHRIMNLALAARGGYLADGPDNWLTGRDPYYFTSVVHNLIAPLAIHELVTRKLTLLDLALDADLHRLHVLAGRAYEALRSDFNLVDPRYSPIVLGDENRHYAPPEDRPVAMPDALEQRWAWRQGLYSGQISQAVEAMLITERSVRRAMTYAEFAKALDGTDLRGEGQLSGRVAQMKASLQPLIDMLRDFHPARRPVTWRILLAQAACYRAIAAARGDSPTQEALLGIARLTGSQDQAAFDWIGDGVRSIPPVLAERVDFAAEQRAALAAADLFLGSALNEFHQSH
ncbi:MAG TPA: hypothetical protein VK432_12385 [Stellaceae bacterium]|nr:hypothetical protein [Stellaceae bacterium]